jgi:hypothetical protein
MDKLIPCGLRNQYAKVKFNAMPPALALILQTPIIIPIEKSLIINGFRIHAKQLCRF